MKTLIRFLSAFMLFFTGIFGVNGQKFDILSADYDLRFFPKTKTVEGTASYTVKILRSTDTLIFDADQKVGIKQIKIGRRKIPFVHRDGKIYLLRKFRPKTLRLTFRFRTVDPKQALYFTGLDNGNKKQIWTQGQGKKHSHWMPVIDDLTERFTWHARLTFPDSYVPVSNGRLLKTVRDSLHRTVTAEFDMNKPVPSYLFFAGAGQYVIHGDTLDGIPHFTYAYPDAPQPDMTFSASADIFRLMPRLIGVPYPWEQYREIPLRDFFYGGMENVTATVFSDFYVVNDTAWNDVNPVNILAHELAHHWFGNYVTETSPVHHWIHESFATFYAWEASARIFGRNHTDFEYYNYIQKIIDAYHEGDTVPLLNGKASSLTFYQKGAVILRMLRDRLGSETFNRVIKHFLESHPYQNVTTSDFQQSLARVTGDSMPDFFRRYFRSSRIPRYKIYKKENRLTVESEADAEALPVRIYFKNRSYVDTLLKGTYVLPDDKSYAFFLPDPGRHRLAELDWDLSPDELRHAVRARLSDLDIYRILLRYEKIPLKDKWPLLYDMAAWDYYYPVHGAVLFQLQEATDSLKIPVVKQILSRGLKSRQAVATDLKTIPRELQRDFESLLDDPSYTTVTAALWKLWHAFPERHPFYLDKTRGKIGFNDRELRMLWILLAVSEKNYGTSDQKKAWIDELIRYASPDYNVETRLTALNFLDMLGLINDRTVPYLRQAASYFHPRLRQKARAILKKYGFDEAKP